MVQVSSQNELTQRAMLTWVNVPILDDDAHSCRQIIECYFVLSPCPVNDRVVAILAEAVGL